MRLKDRVLRAGGWTLGGVVTSHLIRLTTNLLLTRLLVPEMFGVMALVYVVMYGINMFSDIGLAQVVVRSGCGEDPAFLDTVWVSQIVRGALICMAGLGMALALPSLAHLPGVAPDSAYAHRDFPQALALIATTALIRGFESTKAMTARRHLLLGRLTAIELAVQLAGVVVTLTWASFTRSIDALVGGTIIAALLSMAMSHAALPGRRNRLAWRRRDFAEIIGFGKWLFLSSIFGFFIGSGDRLLLGGLLSAHVLGLYSIAAMLAGAVQEVTAKLAGSVAYPALSEVYRDRPAAMRDTFYRIRLPIDLLCGAVAGFLLCGAVALVRVLYDDRYHDAGGMLQILSLSLLAAGPAVAQQAYMVMGKPKLMSWLNGVRCAALYTGVPLLFWHHGIGGAVWGVAAASLVSVPLGYVLQFRLGLFSLRRELLIVPALAAGCLLGLAFTRLCTQLSGHG